MFMGSIKKGVFFEGMGLLEALKKVGSDAYKATRCHANGAGLYIRRFDSQKTETSYQGILVSCACAPGQC